MLSNILIGLVIPGVLIIYLFKKKPVIITLMYPLGIAIAFISNDWGFKLFWEVSPTHENNPSLTAFPYNIGFFPLLSSLFGYIRVKDVIKPHLLIFLFTTISTFMEFVAVWSGKITYYHGWNIFFTLFVYLMGFIGSSFYIKILRNYNVLN